MIIVNIKSGLGNQLFQYAFGESLKQEGYIVKYKLSFSDKSKRSFRLSAFYTNLNEINSEELITFYKYTNPKKLIFPGKNNLLFKILRHIISLFYYKSYKKSIVLKELSADYKKQISEIKDFAIFDGYWTNLRYFDHIRKHLLSQIQLRISWRNTTYDYYLKKIIAFGINSVSVHVRRTDYLTSSHFFYCLDVEYYKRAMKYLECQLGMCAFFVFSDDIEWCKINFNDKKNTSFISSPLLEDVHDFCLIKQCKHNIIANSTLSWWAAYLNNNSQKIVIAPTTWYANDEQQKRYCSGLAMPHPEGWIKL